MFVAILKAFWNATKWFANFILFFLLWLNTARSCQKADNRIMGPLSEQFMYIVHTYICTHTCFPFIGQTTCYVTNVLLCSNYISLFEHSRIWNHENWLSSLEVTTMRINICLIKSKSLHTQFISWALFKARKTKNEK